MPVYLKLRVKGREAGVNGGEGGVRIGFGASEEAGCDTFIWNFDGLRCVKGGRGVRGPS